MDPLTYLNSHAMFRPNVADYCLKQYQNYKNPYHALATILSPTVAVLCSTTSDHVVDSSLQSRKPCLVIHHYPAAQNGGYEWVEITVTQPNGQDFEIAGILLSSFKIHHK